jgi:hypothetical protein
MKKTQNKTVYRVALGIAVVAALLLVWLSLGVGVIGADGDPANLMYLGVVAFGVLGAIGTRLQPLGMSNTLFVMAAALALILLAALATGLGLPYSGALELILLNGFFVAMFAVSGWLFRIDHESK